MPGPIVTFTSDFGLHDWFVGVVHGVLRQHVQDVRIVDLTHTIAPGDIEAAAFVVEASAGDFPPGTIHLVVVDPGVGTPRLALVVAARDQYFVGPDNGVLDWAFEDPGANVFAITDPRYLRHPVSRTFHGRDVFAPVAAHLLQGVPPSAFGTAVPSPVRLPSRNARAGAGRIEGRIAYIDRFGNALTNVGADLLAATFRDVPAAEFAIEVVGRRILGATESYGDARIGTLVALIGSSGRLEIAEVSGHGASRFGFGRGDPVVVTRATG